MLISPLFLAVLSASFVQGQLSPPHIHREHYVDFFSFKGGFPLWIQKGEGEQQTRLLTQGDHGSALVIPRTLSRS